MSLTTQGIKVYTTATTYDVKVQPSTGYSLFLGIDSISRVRSASRSSGQPMVIASDGTVIVDEHGKVVYKPLVDKLNSFFNTSQEYNYTTFSSGILEAWYYALFFVVPEKKYAKIYVSKGEYYMDPASKNPWWKGNAYMNTNPAVNSTDNKYSVEFFGDGESTIIHLPVNDVSNPQGWMFTLENPGNGYSLIFRDMKLINDTATQASNYGVSSWHYIGFIVTSGGNNSTGHDRGIVVDNIHYVIDNGDVGWVFWFNGTYGVVVNRWYQENLKFHSVYDGGNILFDSVSLGSVLNSTFIDYTNSHHLNTIDNGTGNITVTGIYVLGAWAAAFHFGSCDGSSSMNVSGSEIGENWREYQLGIGAHVAAVFGYSGTQGRFTITGSNISLNSGILSDGGGSPTLSITFVGNTIRAAGLGGGSSSSKLQFIGNRWVGGITDIHCCYADGNVPIRSGITFRAKFDSNIFDRTIGTPGGYDYSGVVLAIVSWGDSTVADIEFTNNTMVGWPSAGTLVWVWHSTYPVEAVKVKAVGNRIIGAKTYSPVFTAASSKIYLFEHGTLGDITNYVLGPNASTTSPLWVSTFVHADHISGYDIPAW